MWGSVVTFPDGTILRRIEPVTRPIDLTGAPLDRDPVAGPREELLNLLKERVMANEELSLCDRRTVRAREKLEELEREQQEAWTVVRSLSVAINQSADELWLEGEING